MAVQEAWNCASPTAINAILGFKTASRENEGVALLARYGFSGPLKYERIDPAFNRWLIGGDVCIDPMCAPNDADVLDAFRREHRRRLPA